MDEMDASAFLTRLETLENECRVLSRENHAFRSELTRIRRRNSILFMVRLLLVFLFLAYLYMLVNYVPRNRVYTGRWFNLKDVSGNTTATLSSTTDGSPILNLVDPSNADRVIRIWNDRTIKSLHMELNNGKKQLAIETGPEADDVASMTFSDRTGTVRLRLGLGRSGSPGLELLDKNGKKRLDLGLFGDGRPRIELLGERENTIAQLKIESDGDATFSFLNLAMDPLVELRSTAAGASSASFRDGSGRSRLMLETKGVESAPIIRIESGGKSILVPEATSSNR